MCDLVARTGRHQQRYEAGCRLVAGCIPFKYRKCDESCGSKPKKIVEVLMINSQSGPGLLFPKGGWENDETVEEAAVREALEEAGVRGDIMEFLGFYYFKSKSHQDEFSPEGLCKAAMFAMHVKEELGSWPEQSTRHRRWLTIPEAGEQCRHPWMREALLEGFSKWHANKMMSAEEDHPGPISSTPAR
ncbi:nudix hydrolase 16, mitochondrial [Elaeis guineensis]|uniref:Nudix hydrolase 16, mitochondrial n=1 Tax=Elaeis guineensis var. tenera TaxID=51953 RepID=A0A6J0PNF5_ELAGV|nr:nudix hydrolase 16, mitochondrial [Elaeis guineensis]